MRVLLVTAVLFSIPIAVQSTEETNLVGTWQLVEFVNYVDGNEVHPFGENPKGYFTYTHDGRVTIQIQHEIPPSSWKSLETNNDGTGTQAPWYVGYFGRYTVDPASAEVTHHVEGGTLLHYIGTDQIRPFTLSENRLVIGEPGAWERVLVRVE